MTVRSMYCAKTKEHTKKPFYLNRRQVNRFCFDLIKERRRRSNMFFMCEDKFKFRHEYKI